MMNRRNNWKLGLVTVLGLLVLGWLIVWLRAELAVRQSAETANALITAGKFQEAAGPLAHWLKARPRSAEAHFHAARGALGLGRLDEGFAELRTAGELGYPAQQIDRQRGIVLSQLGQYRAAEPLLRKVFVAHVSGSPPDLEVDEALARCYLETFQLRAADEVIKRWMTDDPQSARATFWKAEVLRHKANVDQDELITLYEQVLRFDPGHDKARLALAELYLKTHRSELAEREYTSYVQRHPDDAEACLGLGQITAEQGKDEKAIQLLEHAARLAPKDDRPLVERGKLEIHHGRLKEAMEFFDRAVQMDFTEPEVHYQRSLLLTQLGRTGEAKQEQMETARLRQEKDELAALLKDLLRFPDDVQLQFKAARWLFDRGHPEEGRRWAEKILNEHPRHAEASQLLAGYYERIGNPGLANFYRMQAGGR